MFEKQKSMMDSQDLIFNSEISTATPTTFADSITMAFTPTTLASFEAELLASQAIPTDVLVSEASGNQFWPGTSMTSSCNFFNMDDDDDNDDDSSSVDSDSNFSATVIKTGASGNAATVFTMTQSGKQQQICAVKPVEQKQRKLPGPRPSKPIEEMTPIEAERRRRRRERNKNAAAKCRQRRLELTNELLAETEQLEKESHKLEREIENLRRMKNQLEYVLESHKSICTAMPPITDTDFGQIPAAATFSQNSSTTGFNQDLLAVSNVCVVRPNNLPIPSFSTSGLGNTVVCTSNTIEGSIFSLDTPTTFAGLTPLLAAGDLNSPSSFILFSP